MVVLKIKFGEDTRRVTLAEASFPKLNALLNQIFPYNNEGFTTKYQDEDGDMVNITSTPELQEAFKVAEKPAQNGVLRLFVSLSSEHPKSAAPEEEGAKKNVETPKPTEEKKESTSSTFGLSSLVGMLGNSALSPFIPQIIGNPVISSMLVQMMSNDMIRSNVLALLSNPTIATLAAQFAPQFLANPALLASVLPLLSAYSQPQVKQTSSSTSNLNGNYDYTSLFNNLFTATPATSSNSQPAQQTPPSQSNQQLPEVDLNAIFTQMGHLYTQFADQFSSAFLNANAQTPKAEEPAAPSVEEVPTAEIKVNVARKSKEEEIKKVKHEAILVEDVTVPDGTNVTPDQPFPKIWRMRNGGTTAWPEGTILAFQNGDRLSSQDSVAVPSVQPGQTADITIVMKAPTKPGRYISFWSLRSDMESFGHRVWADVTVTEPQQPVYNKLPVLAPTPSPVPSDQKVVKIPEPAPVSPPPAQIPSVQMPPVQTPVISQSVRLLLDMGISKDPFVLQQALDRHDGDLTLAIQDLLGL